MSGIVGLLRLDGRPVQPALMERMNSSLAHRGADGAKLWSERCVGLGHRMLWTTPESLHEQLPLASQNGEFVLTADARIDNRHELLVSLGLNDRPAEEVSDSALILAAYEKWGSRCPERLLGDFVFVVWERRRQMLFCARDHFGVKPLYYFYQPGRLFACASEIKALLALPEVPRRLNEVQVADYLSGIYEDNAATYYQDILRLPPAHSVTISVAGISRSCYWSLDPSLELRLGSDEEYASAFREKFTEAVGYRLRSAFPRGSQLSGGLDSSAVTCVARKLSQQTSSPLWHTFSNIFEAVPECDERPFIDMVLAQGGYIPHFIHADRVGPLVDLDRVFWLHDEPAIGPNHFLPWQLNLAAKEAGVRIVLDGFDGDTTVSHGAVRFTELAYAGDWETFAMEANAVSRHFNVSPDSLLRAYGLKPLEQLAKRHRWIAFSMMINQLNKHFQVSRRDLVWQHGLKPLAPSRLSAAKDAAGRIGQVVNPDFAREVGLRERIRRLDLDQGNPARTVREDQWRTLTSAHFPGVLELSDRCAAAFSIEIRHPFLDKRLVEFCLALPAEQKLNQGWGRNVMRRALANVLPEEIRWRGGKTNMNPNFMHGLLRNSGNTLGQVVGGLSEQVQKYVDKRALDEVYQRFIHARGGKVEDAMTLWKVVTLACWLRQTAF
ncbi:MAG: lasso peptide isopeptide bond-forming cyclase [Betaproteobacteria bacterium]